MTRAPTVFTGMTTMKRVVPSPPTARTTVAPLRRTSIDTRRRTTQSPHISLVHLDSGLTVLAADSLFARRYGDSGASPYGRHLFALLQPSPAHALDRQFSLLATGDQDSFTEHVIALQNDGVPLPVDITGTVARNADPGLPSVSYLVAVRPVEEVDPPTSSRPHAGTLLSPLHARILEGIAGGASNIQLAARLHLSRQGIDYHVGRLLRQLRAPNRAALVARAHSFGMLTVGAWPPHVPQHFIHAESTTVPPTTGRPGPASARWLSR
jgi:DNA-binding CsgD family transcriptional regulator